MTSLSNTRDMFNFVLVLYLLGFVAMMTRWRTKDLAEDESTERELQQRDKHDIHSSGVQVEINAKDLPEAVQNDDSLNTDKEMPVLSKDRSLESKERPPKESEQKSPETGSGNDKINAKNTIKRTDRRAEKSSVRGKAIPLITETKSTLHGKPDEKTLWKAEQAKRKHTLHHYCNRLIKLERQESNVSEIIKSNKRRFWPFIFEDRYRLIYTFISKVGSTNWKSAFLVLKGKYKTVEGVPGRFAHSPSLVKLSSLPDEGIKHRLDNYTNFIFVRHPFARVLSAYRSKFLQPNRTFQKGIGVRIIKMYRRNATKEALATGSGVTFPEFVQYLTNAKVINFDGHWRPIYKMVLPCAVRFDYIGKLETGEEDAEYILQDTHVDHLIHFKATKRNVSHDDTIFNHFFSQIPSSDLVKLYKLYEPDFKLFGYEVPDSMEALFKTTLDF